MNQPPPSKVTFGGLAPAHQAIVDRLCDQFERDCRQSRRVSIEPFLQQSPAELRPHVLRELVAIEVEYRCRRGDQPTWADYQQRFPTLDSGWFDSLVAERSRAALPARSPALEASVSNALSETLGGVANDGQTVRAAGHRGERRPRMLGEYELIRELGRGGMGRVYLARHRRMDRIVAIKTLAPQFVQQPNAVQRFHREVKAAARLIHPNIVTAYDAGEQDGVHFLVMEYVAGADFRSLVARDGPLPIKSAVDYVLQAATGLARAHRQGVVHRDVKPSNLLLDNEGTVKILDLGLARLEWERSHGEGELTAPNMLIGTVAFMAPEQGEGPTHVDARADVYSLGCTLFFLLTGQAPYQEKTIVDTILAHQHKPVVSLREARPDAPAELDAICRRMLAKMPSERPQSMDEVIDALQQIANPSVKVVAQPRHESVLRTRSASSDRIPQPRSTARGNRRRSVPTNRLVAGALGLLLVGLLMIVGRNLLSRQQEGGSESAARMNTAVDSLPRFGVAPIEPSAVDSPPANVATDDPGAPALLVAPFYAGQVQQAWNAWTAHLGIDEPWTYNSIGVKLMLVPPGQFTMGINDHEREEWNVLANSAAAIQPPANPVSPRVETIPYPFWLGRHEISVGEFRQFIEATGYVTEAERTGDGWGLENGQWKRGPGYCWNNLGELAVTDDLPACSLTWHDAVEFCGWMSDKETRETGQLVEYRLPTEVEWEYACRAGAQSPWHFGDGPSDLAQYAWFAGNAGGVPHPVGHLLPNAFHLFDILGNEAEWCWDQLPNDQRVQRGGSYADDAGEVTNAARRVCSMHTTAHGAFRLLREMPSQ